MVTRRILAPVIAVALLFVAAGVHAAPDVPAEFTAGTAALERGAFSEAIDRFELLADHGFVHPDASYNRAAAYVARAQTPSAEPGDLGRAAAALREAMLLRPDFSEAEDALARVDSEIARRNVRKGAKSSVIARPSLGRALAALMDENVVAVMALLGSALLTSALLVRHLAARSATKLAANVAIAVGALVLTVFGGLTALSRHYRRTSEEAVVVVPEARLVDERGTRSSVGASDGVIPEGALVYVLERRGPLFHVEWGTTRGYLNAGQLRLLARP